MSDEEILNGSISFALQYCQHYVKGSLQKGVCQAGISLDEFTGRPLPCILGNKKSEEEQLVSCSKWLRTTPDQAKAHADEKMKALNRMRKVMPVVAEWRKKPPRGKAEIIQCPECGGKLHLSQASSNGHVWGNCETKGCVSWME